MGTDSGGDNNQRKKAIRENDVLRQIAKGNRKLFKSYLKTRAATHGAPIRDAYRIARLA
ncbi:MULTISPECIES: hypothetical protein [Paraburkholderia]|uniref:hypothetical protein n=1 Tax=Paraburkholderia TaxID=1822464 RepID=UPI001CC5DBF5|nr:MULTISPECIES: hypothetical protein [Paraburkholderia]